MMQFLFQPLTIAFLLVLLPLLIHLINLMRQRKVEWAAMEFLLKSHKKHRRWVWLKQFVLLLLRMLAIAVVVAMLAGLVSQEQASFLGGQATHHYILLDDSLSMADRTSGGRAFDAAMQALSRIAEQLANEASDQKVTLLRFSRANMDLGEGSAADMNAVLVDSEFATTMEAAKRRMDVSELAVEPGPVLEMANRLIGNAAEKRRVVYLLSDFRTDPWESAQEMKESLRNLRQVDADVHLIHCSSQQHQNLSIVELLPDAGTLAAGVPVLVTVKVQNHGPAAAQQVAVRVAAKSYPADVVVQANQDVTEEQVTTLVIDEIPANESAVRQVQLKFDRTGQHVVEAQLTSDSIVEDNVRRCVLEVPPGIPVLVVDGTSESEEAFYLESIFSPGRVLTGIQPVARSATFLRDVADTELARFAAIYLLNVERIDEKGMRALERYVRGGGGLAIFCGENIDPAFYNNEFFRGGEGLFPIPVRGPRDHLRADSNVPDLQASDHPIFRVLVDEGGENRPLAKRIRIRRYLGMDPETSWDDLPQARPLASLPSGDPVVVSRSFGDGEVIAFLTTASPTWNNWAMGPTYPVVILQLQGYLAANRQTYQAATVGEVLRFQLENTEYQPEIELVLPATNGEVTSRPSNLKKTADTAPGDSQLLTFTIGGSDAQRNGETDRSGVYLAKLQTLDGQSKQRRFVANPPTSESDLATVPIRELVTAFDDLGIEVHEVDELKYEGAYDEGFSWSNLLAGLLVVLLLGEQLFAYSASYHPRGGGGER